MNVLQINTSAGVGGAAKVMMRLHGEFKRRACAASALTADEGFVAPDVLSIARVTRRRYIFWERWLDGLGQRLAAGLGMAYTHHRTTWLALRSDVFNHADVVNLHNLHGGYFNYHALPQLCQRKAVVWTLHDMWGMTGHCAYAYDCQRWKSGCFDCPLLKGPAEKLVEPPPTRLDCTRQVWHAKRRLYQRCRLHIVTPSQWLCDLAKESILAEGAASIQCIPNGLDLAVFQPIDQALARQVLGIEAEARVILFVSSYVAQKRKGFFYLLEVFERLERTENVVLLTVGEQSRPSRQLDHFRRRHLGALYDEHLMCLAYNAADAFVFPSLADNQALTLIEALACGTPIVAFDVGGTPEMVRHMETGYLARYKDAQDMAHGLDFILGNGDARERMRQRCREIALAEYSLDLQARRYLDLYEQAIACHIGGEGK